MPQFPPDDPSLFLSTEYPRVPCGSSARHGLCFFGLMLVREDEFDRCVTDLKLRAARERIRAREERGEGHRAFGGLPAGKKPLDRILELRRADVHRCRLGLGARELG